MSDRSPSSAEQGPQPLYDYPATGVSYPTTTQPRLPLFSAQMQPIILGNHVSRQQLDNVGHVQPALYAPTQAAPLQHPAYVYQPQVYQSLPSQSHMTLQSGGTLHQQLLYAQQQHQLLAYAAYPPVVAANGTQTTPVAATAAAAPETATRRRQRQQLAAYRQNNAVPQHTMCGRCSRLDKPVCVSYWQRGVLQRCHRCVKDHQVCSFKHR